MRSRYAEIPNYVTKDGSVIRELMHPSQNQNENQSLAEATVPANTSTELHLHKKTEEIYHILAGSGEMTLGDEIFNVECGDTVCIRPDTPHKIRNTGTTELRFICACSPAYSHEDTFLLT